MHAKQNMNAAGLESGPTALQNCELCRKVDLVAETWCSFLNADPMVEEAVTNAAEYGAGNSIGMAIGTAAFYVPTRVVEEVA